MAALIAKTIAKGTADKAKAEKAATESLLPLWNFLCGRMDPTLLLRSLVDFHSQHRLLRMLQNHRTPNEHVADPRRHPNQRRSL